MVIQIGKSQAYIDLVSMKVYILWLMKKPFPIAMALGTAAQFVLAAAMVWYAQGGLRPAAVDDEHVEAYFMALLDEGRTADARKGADTFQSQNSWLWSSRAGHRLLC